MKLHLVVLLMLFVLLGACGDYHRGGAPYNAPEDDETLSFDINQMNAEDVAGLYKVTLMSFDSDPAETHTTEATVTTVMRHIEGSTDGDPWFKQGALTSGLLNLLPNGTYFLEYKIENASHDEVEIGNFSVGKQSGFFDVLGNIIVFLPNVTEDAGFAHSNDSNYMLTLENKSFVFKATKTSLTGDYLSSLKATP